MVVPIQNELPCGILNGKAVGGGTHFFNSDGRGSDRKVYYVVIARSEAALIERALHCLAGGVVAIAGT